MFKVLVLTALAVGAVSADAAGQAVQRPTRPYRGLFGGGAPQDPNRVRHDLTLTASVLGGYEDQLSIAGSGPPQPGQPAESGTTGTLDASLQYFVGRALRSFSVDGRTYANAYSVDADPLIGGDVRVVAQTELGRLHRLDVSQSISYQPTLVLGAFAPLATGVDAVFVPEGQTNGFVRQRSFSSNSSASVQRNWTPRQTTSADYDYADVTYLDEVGFDSRRHTLGVQHSWRVSRTSSVQGSYRRSAGRLDDETDEGTPLTDHNLEASVSYTRRLSATRQIHFSGGGGAIHVATLNAGDRSPLEYWTPSASGSVGFDLGRSWAVVADYRRAASVLPGVTLQSFATDAASVRADGMFGPRIEMAMSGAFSNGRSGGDEGMGRFESVVMMAQSRFAVSRCCAVSASYNYYYYHLMGVVNPQPGVPSEYGQNAVRIGLTFWLPLHGSVGRNTGGRDAQ